VKKRNSTKFCEIYFFPGLTGSVNRPLASSKIMVDEDFSLEASNIQRIRKKMGTPWVSWALAAILKRIRRKWNPLSILGISSNTQRIRRKGEPPEYPGH
jgi:hypothetical protein